MPYQQAELRAADSERKAAVGRLPAACGLAFLSALPALLSGPGTADYTAYGAGGVIIVLIAALEVWLRRETLKKMIMTNRLVLKELQAEAREQRAKALRQQGEPATAHKQSAAQLRDTASTYACPAQRPCAQSLALDLLACLLCRLACAQGFVPSRGCA
jgi:hypothetical protein